MKRGLHGFALVEDDNARAASVSRRGRFGATGRARRKYTGRARRKCAGRAGRKYTGRTGKKYTGRAGRRYTSSYGNIHGVGDCDSRWRGDRRAGGGRSRINVAWR